jgi:hypothetical protein
MSLTARLVLVVVVLGLAVAAGWRQGVRATLADWRAADLERAQSQAAAEDDARQRARAAAWQYERERDRIQTDLTEVRRALSRSLARPVAGCSASAPLALGDVVLPADVLDGVRSVGAGAPDDRAAAAGPGQPVQPGAGDSNR